MYDYIKGLVVKQVANSITLENNNIGYLIKTANPYVFKIGTLVTIYLYQIIREDSNDLYGFISEDERTLFLKLISVKGLGPKGALAILATSSINDIVDAINQNDANYFKKFPGIGVKCSQQIILDLKGKLDISNNKTNEELKDLIQALKSLGFSTNEIKTITSNFNILDYPSLSDALKEALKRLMK